MYSVEEFYQKHRQDLGLKLLTTKSSLKRIIRTPHLHTSNLFFAGHLKNYDPKRILVIGKIEIEFLRDLEPTLRVKRLKTILSAKTPAVIVTQGCQPDSDFIRQCIQGEMPLFQTDLETIDVLSRLHSILVEQFAECVSYHGTLVEIHGVGVMLKGDSSVGKTETALNLMERGHSLIADDFVNVKKLPNGRLEGSACNWAPHHMAVNGIGIINIAQLYGITCTREKTFIDLVVQMSAQNNAATNHKEKNSHTILETQLPMHNLTNNATRNLALILETLALNHRQKKNGIDTEKEFSRKQKKLMRSGETE